MKFIDCNKGVLGLRLSSPPTEREMDEISTKAAEIRKDGSISIFLELTDPENFEEAEFFNKLREAVQGDVSLNKVAVLTDRSWIERFGELITYLKPLESQTFDEGKKQSAIDWVTDEKTDREDKPATPDR